MSRKHISCISDQGWIDVCVPPDSAEEFKQLVRRAIGTWPGISPEMRDFADRLLGREKVMGKNMKWELGDPPADSSRKP